MSLNRLEKKVAKMLLADARNAGRGVTTAAMNFNQIYSVAARIYGLRKKGFEIASRQLPVYIDAPTGRHKRMALYKLIFIPNEYLRELEA